MLDIDEPIGGRRRPRGSATSSPGSALRHLRPHRHPGRLRVIVVEVDGRTIWIDLPIRRDGMLDAVAGQLVSVRFDRPGDAVYLFDSVVADVVTTTTPRSARRCRSPSTAARTAPTPAWRWCSTPPSTSVDGASARQGRRPVGRRPRA